MTTKPANIYCKPSLIPKVSPRKMLDTAVTSATSQITAQEN